MTDVRIETGAVEPIQLFVVDVAGAPLTGLADIYVRARREDGKYLDWADMTFKASGWTTLNKILAEADAINAPGLYLATGGLDTSAITNPITDDYYSIIPLQTPGTNAQLPGPSQIAVGKWVDTIEAIGAGVDGTFQIDVTTEDLLAVPTQGAQIDIYDATNTNFINRFYTDLSGQVSLALDAGTYKLRILAQGVAFTIPETLVVTVDASETYTGTAIEVTTPPADPAVCRIYGVVEDAAGIVVAGAHIEAWAVTPQAANVVQLSERLAVTSTDATGQFELDLVRNSTVRITIEGTDVDIERVVPDLATQEFTAWT